MGFSIRRTERIAFTLDDTEITLVVRRLPADTFIGYQSALALAAEQDAPQQALVMVDLLTHVIVGWEGIDEECPTEPEALRRMLLDAGVSFISAAVTAYVPKMSAEVGNG